MGFEDIAAIILRNNKRSLQVNINEFVKKLKESKEKYSKSSYTKARAKISPSLFVELNNRLIKSYYEDKEDIKLYKEFRVFAIDGSIIQLPNVESISLKTQSKEKRMKQELRDIYGCSSNKKSQYGTIARVSILEDIENNIIHQGIFNSYYASEKDMAIEHIKYLDKLKKESSIEYKDLILFDRGYPSYALLILLESKNIDYVIRMPKKRFKEIDEFRENSKEKDKIITLTLTQEKLYDIRRNNRYHPFIKEKKVEDKIVIRAIKVKLPSKEIEILITSLIDKKEYKTILFKSLYFKRWRVEEEYKAIKALMQVENFTGITQIAINQDFFATIFMLNMTNLLINATYEEKIKEFNKSKERKYKYKINRSFSIGIIKDEFIYLVVNEGDIEAFYYDIIQAISTNLTPIKPNRSFSRKRKGKHKYPTSQKRNI